MWISDIWYETFPLMFYFWTVSLNFYQNFSVLANLYPRWKQKKCKWPMKHFGMCMSFEGLLHGKGDWKLHNQSRAWFWYDFEDKEHHFAGNKWNYCPCWLVWNFVLLLACKIYGWGLLLWPFHGCLTLRWRIKKPKSKIGWNLLCVHFIRYQGL